MDASEREPAPADRQARIKALVRQLSETECALQELLAGEVGAVVDSVRDMPIITHQAQAELRRGEAHTRLLEQVPTLVWMTDGDLRMTAIAGREMAVLAMTPDRVVGRSLLDLVREHPGLAGALVAHYRALEGSRVSYEISVEGRALRGTIEPLRDETGRIVGCVGLGLDVTRRRCVDDAFGGKLGAARRRLEALAERGKDLAPEHRALVEEVLGSSFVTAEEAQVANTLLRTLLDVMPVGVVVCNAEGALLMTNPPGQEILGGRVYGEVESPARTYTPCYPDGSPFPADEMPLARAMELGETVDNVEILICREDGSERTILAGAAPVQSEAGEIVSGVTVFQDITARKRVEEALQRERNLLGTVMENTRTQLAYLDANFDFVMVNSPYATGSGYEKEELVGRNHFDLFPDADNQAIFERVRDAGEPVEFHAKPFEFPDRPERGTTYWDWTLVPVKDNGEVCGLVLSLLDVTEQERARRALRRYADRLQGLHEADRAILAAHSVGEIAEAALRRVPDLLNCVRADVMRYDLDVGEMTLLAVHATGETRVGPGWRGGIDDEWAAVLQDLAQGAPYTIEDVQHAPSRSPWLETLRVERVRALVAVPLIVDGELIGSLNLGMCESGQLSPGQKEVAGELAIQLAIGMRQAELYAQVQRHAGELEQRVQRRTAALQASQARLRAIFDNAAVGIALVDLEGYVVESNPGLLKMLRYTAEELAGKHFVEFTHPADVEADEALFQELLVGKRESYALSRRCVRKDGSQLWGNLHVSLIRNSQDEPRFAVALVEDITEQREAQRALMQSEKLALTGRLAASLAHEINNPLQSVIGSLDLADESLEEGEIAGARQMLQLGTEELQRAASIVTQLRDLSRPSELEDRELVDVKDLLDQVLLLTKKQCRKHKVEVVWEPGRELPRLSVAPDQIKQVFLNLVLNAVEAMPDGGQLAIRALRTDEPEGVSIALHDTGPGIPPEVLPRLFEPFYTTKEQGLGLGLYVTYGIVDAHGGRIDVENQAGRGTTFTVWLPAEGG
jgi:PAS domain S-box-containing protein